jgi:hypothetical protein
MSVQMKGKRKSAVKKKKPGAEISLYCDKNGF